MARAKPHPLGEPLPDSFFAWVEVTQRVTYHALVISAPNATEAERLALEMYEHGEAAPQTVTDENVTIRIVPRREKHQKE